MRFQLVIFDFDGTLADSFPWFLSVVNQVADRYRFRRIEDHEIEVLRGCGARQVVTHLGVPAWKMPLIARHMRRIMARDLGQIGLFPGVDQLLQGLAGRGVGLSVVSSNSLANVQQVLGADNAALIRHYGCGASIFGKRAKLKGGPPPEWHSRSRDSLHRRRDPGPARGASGRDRIRGGQLGLHGSGLAPRS